MDNTDENGKNIKKLYPIFDIFWISYPVCQRVQTPASEQASFPLSILLVFQRQHYTIHINHQLSWPIILSYYKCPYFHVLVFP